MADLLPRSRRATIKDARRTFIAVRELVRAHHYQVALTGSQVTRGQGNDIDLVVAAADDAKLSAVQIANIIIPKRSRMLYSFERTDEHDRVGFTCVQHDKTVLDCYIIGHGED